MIVKVAEEHAHRKAFPRQFTGMYGEEELPLEGSILESPTELVAQPEPKSAILLQDEPEPAATEPQPEQSQPEPEGEKSKLETLFADAVSKQVQGSTIMAAIEKLKVAGLNEPSEAQIEKGIRRAAKLAGAKVPIPSADDCDKVVLIMDELATAAKEKKNGVPA